MVNFRKTKIKNQKSEVIIVEKKAEASSSEVKSISPNDKDKVIDISDIHIEAYNQQLKSVFITTFEINPQAFRLHDKNNIKLVHYNFNKKYITNEWNGISLIYEKDANYKYEFIDFTSEDFYLNYGEYSYDELFKKSTIAEHLNIQKNNIVYNININSLITMQEKGQPIFKETLEKVFGSVFIEGMKDLIRDEGRHYQKHTNHPSGYYAKNAARYSYSLLDLSPIIKKVDDEDFEYQLDQAIAAYDNSLYMASCATLGVCLETVCKIMITRSGGKIKDSDATMLDRLADRLRQEGLISYKDKSRIDISYKVRNLSSHTSPGKVTQNDCHFLINTLQSLVEQYLD